jgi:hypothetical protein
VYVFLFQGSRCFSTALSFCYKHRRQKCLTWPYRSSVSSFLTSTLQALFQYQTNLLKHSSPPGLRLFLIVCGSFRDCLACSFSKKRNSKDTVPEDRLPCGCGHHPQLGASWYPVWGSWLPVILNLVILSIWSLLQFSSACLLKSSSPCPTLRHLQWPCSNMLFKLSPESPNECSSQMHCLPFFQHAHCSLTSLSF